MDGRSGKENVNSRFLGELNRLPGAVDIALVATRQAADRRAGDFGGNGADRFEVADRRNGKSRLDHVDPQRSQGSRHLKLLDHVHARARRLLAVTQRRIKDSNPVRVGMTCRFR